MIERSEEYVIKEILESELDKSAEVIRESFGTIALDFGLTKENCPTNGAFIEAGRLISDKSKGIKMFGLFTENGQKGFVAIEKLNDSAYVMEKLAVLPMFRHLGYGKALLDYTKEYVKSRSGEKVTIGIIDENVMLKQWYLAYGFIEKEKRIFSHLPFTVCFMELKI